MVDFHGKCRVKYTVRPMGSVMVVMFINGQVMNFQGERVQAGFGRIGFRMIDKLIPYCSYYSWLFICEKLC